jgi:hypothetical protein
MGHLHKPSSELVLHAAQYFAVIANERMTAPASAQCVPLLEGLVSVLDPARALKLECRTSAAMALSIVTGSALGKATFLDVATTTSARDNLTFWLTQPPRFDRAQLQRCL